MKNEYGEEHLSGFVCFKKRLQNSVALAKVKVPAVNDF